MLGPHVNRLTAENTYFLPIWQPAVAVALHQSQTDNMGQRIKTLSPATTVIGRLYRADGWYSENIMRDPFAAADEMATWVRTAAMVNPGVSYWQTNNEVCQQTPDQLRQLSLYTRRLCVLSAPSRIAGGCFGTGQPSTHGDDGGASWTAWLPGMLALAEFGGILLIHEYTGGPDHFLTDDYYHLGRYQHRARPYLPAAVRDLPFVLGETGCDYGVIAAGVRKGWRSQYQGNVDWYMDHMLMEADELAGWPGCLGGALYQAGETGGTWADFAIDGPLLDALARNTGMYQEPTPAGWTLPEHEPLADVGVLADKCRWWIEEEIRQRKAGDPAYADAIALSLVNRDNGLMYRQERTLKLLPAAVRAMAIG